MVLNKWEWFYLTSIREKGKEQTKSSELWMGAEWMRTQSRWPIWMKYIVLLAWSYREDGDQVTRKKYEGWVNVLRERRKLRKEYLESWWDP